MRFTTAAWSALLVGGCLLGGCRSSSSGAGDKPVNPASSDVETSGAEVRPVDYRLVRDAARRIQASELPLLQRHLAAGGPARLWAAFGLGKLCKHDRPGVTAGLISALATWSLEPAPPSALELRTLARALGSCATEESEHVLRSWVSASAASSLPGLAEAAAFGLGTQADRSGRLEERTLTVLLDAAEREKNRVLLYPVGRLPALGDALAARTLDVAGELLTQKAEGPHQFAILALGSVGPSASLPLVQLALKADFPASERALAVQALGRLGPAGARALDQTTKELLGRGLPAKADDATWVVLGALLKLLEEPHDARQALAELGRAPLGPTTTPAERGQRRRMIALRCRAAALVAQANEMARGLLECDPEHGAAETEARLEVLGRGPLKAKRASAFAELTKTDNPRLLQAALRLLPRHAEYEGTLELLISALGKPEAGTRATALGVIAAHPERVYTRVKESEPDPRVVTAVQAVLETVGDKPALETIAAALGAAGALGTLTLKPAVERHCLGPHRALHARAQAALGLLGNPNRECRSVGLAPPAAVQAPAADPKPVVVHIDSDLGALELRLDNPDTEAARRRIVELIGQHQYDGVAVAAAAFGFAVTFGDRDGDGYENGDLVPLADELGPSEWSGGSVGFTSFAADAAGSQLLVTLGEAPAMTGEKTRLGTASGPWQLLMPGDVFSSVRME